MTKVVVGMSVSLDGIAGPEAPDADGMKVFAAVMDWVFPLRSWRAQQGQEAARSAGAYGCSAPPARTCAAPRPSRARAPSTCATRFGDGAPYQPIRISP